METGFLVTICWYGFSTLMSTAPPLPDNCNYFIRWAHDAGQALAANWNKIQRPAK